MGKHCSRHRLTASVAYVTTLTCASTNEHWAHLACSLVSSLKTKPWGFSSIQLPRFFSGRILVTVLSTNHRSPKISPSHRNLVICCNLLWKKLICGHKNSNFWDLSWPIWWVICCVQTNSHSLVFVICLRNACPRWRKEDVNNINMMMMLSAELRLRRLRCCYGNM